jgi:septum site-determining protein MinD
MAGETYVITSGKGGVGKTTATANLGVGLALRGRKVVVIDTDIGLRNLDVVMGLENRIVYDLVDVVEGRCKLNQATIRDKHVNDLYLIPAAQTRDKSAVQPQQMKELCEQLKQDFEYVLIDCPAGIEQGFRNAIAAAERAIVVTTPEVSAIRDADRVIGLLEAAEIKTPYLVINRLRPGMIRQGDMMDKKDILELLSVQMIGLVPDDEQIIVSTNQGVPVVHNAHSWSGEAFRRIAARIDGEEVPFLDLENGRGLFSRIKKIFGLNGNGAYHD